MSIKKNYITQRHEPEEFADELTEIDAFLSNKVECEFAPIPGGKYQ